MADSPFDADGQAGRHVRPTAGPFRRQSRHDAAGGRLPGVVRRVARARCDFLTPPVDHGSEIRCFLRDPDGHLVELSQAVS